MNISNAVLNIKIEDIVPNRFQPREHFADDGIEELAASIKEHGIIQPLVLRKLGDKYEIVAGERRYKAATLAGLTHVPAIISDIDDNKSAEVALVENIQRRNLTSIEEARSYKAILDKGYLTQEQLAAKMGVSQSQIANKLRLLNLCDEVQEALMTQKISERHARALLNVYDFDEQRKWLNRIIKERLTVRQLDLELKKLNTPSDEGNENEIVPLVNIDTDLDSIKKNATNIIAPKVEKDVSSFMIPDENIQKIDNENKPEEEVIVEEEKEEPLNTNRFFNFLEDEGPNMNMGEPNKFINPQPEEFINPFNNNVETLQINTDNNVVTNPEPTPQFIEPQQPVVEPQPMPQVQPVPQPMPQPQVQAEPQIVNPMPQAEAINPFATNQPAVEINPFLEENPFNPVQPQVEPTSQFIESQQPVVEPQPIPQPQIVGPEMVTPQMINPMPQSESVPSFEQQVASAVQSPIPEVSQPLPTANEIINTPGMVNPMNNINNINQPEAEVSAPASNLDVNSAISDIRSLVNKLEQQGFVIRLEELALPNGYQINININN